MKIKLYRFFLAILLLLFTAGIINALEDEEDLPSPTPSQEIKNKIKERLEKNASESGELEDDEEASAAAQPSLYYAFTGKLTGIEKGTLTLQDGDEEKTVETDSKTVIVQIDKKQSRKEVKTDKLIEGNYIIAMGTLDGQLLKAVRVTSNPETEEVAKKIYWGKASEVEDDKITLDDEEQTILPISSNTSVTIKGIENAEATDIQLEDKIYAVTIIEDDNISRTTALFVLPKNGAVRISSPKPELKASPKAAKASPAASPRSSASPKALKKSPLPSPEEE